jgi:ATP/maltotriose-dependent transcriptional regulator MalT
MQSAITHLVAGVPVSDVDAGLDWYTRLFAAARRRMAGTVREGEAEFAGGAILRSMDALREGDDLLVGSRALDRADWNAAREAFEAVLQDEDSAVALEGLGLALWFLGEVAEAIATRERAFDAYARAGCCDDAARVAVWVSHQHNVGGRASAARGWLSRAERALENLDSCAGHGWVAVERARHASNVQEKIQHAGTAMSIARASGDSDLEVFALSVLGRAEVDAGERVHGIELLEEAMAAATSGRVRNVHTLAEAYCNLIIACTSAGEWERATEWCELVDDFARTHETAPLFAACRTVHADVLVATGRWPEAERALETALATHARYVPQMGAPTVATLAELRVRQGRLPEAELLLAGREEHPSSLRALALLRIAEGDPAMAVALLERGLRATAGDAMRAAQLLPPLVDAQLAQGDLDAASAAAAELAEHASASGVRVVNARADLAAARVALAEGRPEHAVESAGRALAAFGAMAMPLDVGEARLELARAFASESPALAEDEARTAFAAFRDLGASRAMDSAAAVLRDLGGAPAGRPRATGDLTARQREVLGLIALGMSNAQIAQSLVISEKTAGHHVSHILTKLGVRNRAEAAAQAARYADRA